MTLILLPVVISNYAYCMRLILLAIFFNFSNLAHASGKSIDNTIQTIGRIEIQGNIVSFIRTEDGNSIPSMLQHQGLLESIAKLKPGDEAIAKGRITYIRNTIEEKTNLRPIFIIESIRPISLRMLGEIGVTERQESSSQFPISKSIYSPMAIPASTEVVAAITLTSSLLLLQSLTASPTEPQVTQQLNSGVILFAGLLATSVFIYEQITETQNKGKIK